MKQTIITVLAGALIISFFACEKQPQTLADYLQLAAKSGKPVLVDFYTDW